MGGKEGRVHEGESGGGAVSREKERQEKQVMRADRER